MAKHGSEEHRRRISRGVERSWVVRKAAQDASLGRPVHVDRWIKDGIVVPELVPIIEARAAQAEAIVQDLGGPDEVTAMQRGMIDGLVKALVAADVEFARMARGEIKGAPDRLATFLNTARANLVALGLHRRSKKVVDITDYLEQAGG